MPKLSDLTTANTAATASLFAGLSTDASTGSLINVMYSMSGIGLGVANSGQVPDALNATAVIRLDRRNQRMSQITQSGALAFSVASSPAPVNGGSVNKVVVVASGGGAPTFTGFAAAGGTWTNTTGRIHAVDFWRDGSLNFAYQYDLGTAVDIVAPTFSSANVGTAGLTLTITYNESLLSTGDGIPDGADYSINASGGTATVLSATVSGATVIGTLSRVIAQSESVTHGYTPGASGRVQDASGNVSTSYSATAVTNNSTQSSGDPYWANVDLLVFNDSASNGSTTFDDESSNNLSATTSGSPDYSNTTPPSGLSTWAKLDRFDEMTWTNAAFNAAGAWTLEAFVRVTSYSGSGQFRPWFSYGDAWVGTYDATNTLVAKKKDGNNVHYSATGLPSAGTTFHVALVHDGSNTALYIDGSRINTAADANDYSTDTVIRANKNSFASGDSIFMGSLRFTNGTARYSGTTYSVPSLPLPNS